MLTLEQLSELLEKNRAAASARVKSFSIGGKSFDFNSASAIMGVVNLSPDSWYRESVCLTTESAIQRGRVLREQGADIVDIGAESTLAYLLSLLELRRVETELEAKALVDEEAAASNPRLRVATASGATEDVLTTR